MLKSRNLELKITVNKIEAAIINGYDGNSDSPTMQSVYISLGVKPQALRKVLLSDTEYRHWRQFRDMILEYHGLADGFNFHGTRYIVPLYTLLPHNSVIDSLLLGKHRPTLNQSGRSKEQKRT